MLDYEDILKELAPCGLNCVKCVGCAEGEIKQLSIRLSELLCGFEGMAAKMAGFVPVFEKYPEFKEVLDFLTRAECTGCRQGGSRLPSCAAKACFKEKNVDFCFQCEEFPCGRNQYPVELMEKWLRMNNRMKEVGVEAFYAEQKDRPRYEKP